MNLHFIVGRMLHSTCWARHCQPLRVVGSTSHVNTTSLFVTGPPQKKTHRNRCHLQWRNHHHAQPVQTQLDNCCANSSTPPSRTQAFVVCEPSATTWHKTVRCCSEHCSESQSSFSSAKWEDHDHGLCMLVQGGNTGIFRLDVRILRCSLL